MRSPIPYVIRAFAVLLLVTAFAPAAPSQVEAPPGAPAPALAQEPAPPRCCFTNPGYAGTCEVQPAKGESCGQILDYLNNPGSLGKDYCGNTTIRGGWEGVACGSKG